MTITQNGNILTVHDNTTGANLEGSVDGNSVLFSYTNNYSSLSFHGTISNSTYMSGSVTAASGATKQYGTWSATYSGS